MPKIKLDHVVSCSSEDADHIANNLLNNETKKKWKCKNTGETSVSVILQLEKSSKIAGIDIGNENSSFVEVLVGRSSGDQDYKIILAMSSFMTPMEARNLSNNNRVRMFTYNDLASSVRDEKWDRIKVVCTQPFNKHVQYGLSFLTLHSPQEPKQEEPSTHIGKFIVRPESPNFLTAGTLFAKRKELTEDKITVAQAIKTSEKPKCKPVKIHSASSSKASSSTDDDKEQRNRNRRALFYDSDEEEANEKIDKVIAKVEEKKKVETPKKTPKKKTENSPKPSSSNKPEKKENKTSNDMPSTSKRKTDTTLKTATKKRKLITKPFEKLLEGVVFTISGIVNPERAILRTQALSMGAKYRPDWDKTCTHLICAFANTPKFNQVQGKGKIVTKSWVKDCHDQHKRLPWRRYALDRNDQGKSESEEEIEEAVEDKDDSPVEEIILNNNDKPKSDYLSGSDTDDEIEKILAKQKKEQLAEEEKQKRDQAALEEKHKTTRTSKTAEEKQNKDQETLEEQKKKKATMEETKKETQKTEEKQNKNCENNKLEVNEDDSFNADTEEEELKKNPAEIKEEIPKIFQSEIFYIDDVFDEKEKQLLQRLIKAFDGVVLTSLRSIVDFVITNADSVETVKERCSNVKCVSCTWIYECHDILKRIPYEKFRLDVS